MWALLFRPRKERPEKELRRLESLVKDVGVAVCAVEGRLEGLKEERRRLEASAAVALAQVNAHFHQVAQHGAVVGELVRAVRKRACQPVSDATVVRFVLDLVRRAAFGDRGCSALGEAAEHVACALPVGVPKGQRCVAVEFVVGEGVAVSSALHAMKRLCQIHVDDAFDQWETDGAFSKPQPALATARCTHAAAFRSNNVFVVGGSGLHSKRLASVERLGVDASAWQHHATISTARVGCGACVVGRVMVVVGGWTDTGWASDVVEAVDTDTGAVSTLPPLPQKVRGCGVVRVRNLVVVTGGWSGLKYEDTVWALELTKGGKSPSAEALRWTALPRLTQPRCYHGAAAGGGRVFACGGESRSGVPTSSCEMLLVRAGHAWDALPPMPVALKELGCCFGGGNVFVAGGLPGPQQAVLALSVREKRWAQVATLSAGRYGCAAVFVGGRRVLVTGGHTHVFREPLAVCEAFDF